MATLDRLKRRRAARLGINEPLTPSLAFDNNFDTGIEMPDGQANEVGAPVQRGANEVIAPTLDSSGDSGAGSRGLPLSFGEAASLGVPLYSMFDNKRAMDDLLDQGIELNPESFDPTLNTVRSLRRPNFTTSTRLPQGSSLAEREAGLRFAEAQTDAREQQFDIADDQFKQRQREGNTQIKNIAESSNVQARNRAKAFNLQTRLRRLGTMSDQKSIAQEGVFKNLIDITNNRALTDAALDAEIAKEIVRNPNSTAEERQEAITKAKGRRFSRRRRNF